jgi:predicted house-cleaning noncanonical NTP pyrophosphatase (MazG superfamily)
MKKLVRDKIPGIIAMKGKSVSFRALQGEELKQALKDKLVEETQELVNATSLAEVFEEIVDVEQVLVAIRQAYGMSDYDFGYMRKEKADAKGTFSCGYFLESVEGE